MFKENLDLVLQYTKQFIDAAMPVAQQAYEIGLLTLRIDAAQSIVWALLFLGVALFAGWKIKSDFGAARTKANLPENRETVWKRDTTDHLPADGFFHFIAGVFAAIAGVVGAIGIVNVWVWVKLFAPQIWLAHQAIEKLVK